MVFESGACVSPDVSGGSVCTAFRALENLTITSLKTKISSTGNATAINLIVKSSVVRTVRFDNLDSSFVTTSQGIKLFAGEGIFFARDTTSARYNASALFELTYEPEIVTPPPALNKLTNVTFTNGANAISAVLSTEDGLLLIAKAQGAPHFQIASMQDTSDAITSTFALFAQRIDEIGFPEPDPDPEPPPPDPPLEQNVSLIIDMHDGHFIAGILTESDFNQLHALNEPGWDIIDSVFTSEHPTKTFIEINIEIQSHILGDFPEPTPDPDPTPDPTPDPVPTTNMVSQSLGVFDLKNDRLTGEILFIAQSEFNPFFYGQTIFNFLSIKDPNGVNLVTKQNDLIFTELERDERLFFDESGFGNTELHIKSFVFSLDAEFNSLAFSTVKEFIVREADPPIEPTPDPIPGTGNKLQVLIKALPILGIAALFFNSAKVGR